MHYIPKKRVTRLLSGIIGTTVIDKEILKVIINMLSTISTFVQPSNSLFSLLQILYQLNLIYSDFASLAQSTAIILTRLKVRKNSSWLDEKVFDECIVSFLKKNMVLNGATATQICSVWFCIISSSETIEESESEWAFLREDYSEITTPIFVSEIHEKLALSSSKANIFLSFKRTITTGAIKEHNIRRDMSMFITYSLSSFCVESIRNLANVRMTIPSTP